MSRTEFEDYDGLDAAICAESDAPMVSKWVVVGEAVEADGSRRIFWMSSNTASPADILGLLGYHTAGVQAQIAQDMREQD